MGSGNHQRKLRLDRYPVSCKNAGDNRMDFPGLLMLLTGWAVLFNVLTFRSGCEAEAFMVDYINDGPGPDQPMSPRLTTMILTIFWITGAVTLATRP